MDWRSERAGSKREPTDGDQTKWTDDPTTDHTRPRILDSLSNLLRALFTAAWHSKPIDTTLTLSTLGFVGSVLPLTPPETHLVSFLQGPAAQHNSTKKMAAPSATGNVGGLRASGFDPKSPSALMLVGDNASADSSGGVDLSVLYSGDGVGCNQFETAALMRMLDARDEIMPPGGRSPGASGLRALSREYRRSVRDCMAGWEEQLASEEGEGLSEEEQKQSEGNLELLKLSSAFVHLSEIYLLPRGGDTSSTSKSSAGLGEEVCRAVPTPV